ncbi:hypothetical protein GOODEAATRI_022315, partial [Goodea atripinnis]
QETLMLSQGSCIVYIQSIDINDMLSCSTHLHHIKALPCQLLSWNKRGLSCSANPTALSVVDFQGKW